MLREVCINPCLINSISKGHLHNTTEAKAKTLPWVGKAKSIKKKGKEVETANILNQKLPVNKSITT